MKTLVRPNGNLLSSLPSLLEDFFTNDWADSTMANRTYGATLPAVNVRETNDDYVLDVAAPGMKREDFKVELENNVLTISSQREDNPDDQQNENYTRKEFSYQSFQRNFSLPENKVDGEKISARYVDGILHITIPKKEEAKIKPVKQIKIS